MVRAAAELKKDVLSHIEEYLARSLSGPQVAEWALSVLVDKAFGSKEALLEDCLVALATLHDSDERFDTARADIEFFRDCLLGKREYHRDLEVRLAKGHVDIEVRGVRKRF